MSIRDRLRTYLGTHNLEDRMSQITDALNRLASQVNAVSAAQATSFTNLQNAIEQLKAGNLDDEQRALVDQIETSLTKLGEDAQRADDGHEPAVDPGDEQPTDPDAPVTDPQGDVLPEGNTGR